MKFALPTSPATRAILLALALTDLAPRVGSAATNAVVTNPFLRAADPHVLVFGNTFWLYPTYSGRRSAEEFYAFSSTNLCDWQRHGPVLQFKDIPWIKADGQPRHGAWAPGVMERGGRFYFYYSVGPQNVTPSRIGVAVGDHPAGPFKDSGKPLLTGGNGFEAIDPMVFTDAKSGQAYFYAGGSAGAKLRVFELNADWTSIAREVPVATPTNFTEGAFMHAHNGRYFLSYSHGGWQDSSYSVHYATADTPTGPWKYRGAILTSNDQHKGPGHHSFVSDPRSGAWLIFYHRWNHAAGRGPFRGSREVCVERLELDAAGLIKPVVMSDEWTRSSGP
jgi:beta-xylosidase